MTAGHLLQDRVQPTRRQDGPTYQDQITTALSTDTSLTTVDYLLQDCLTYQDQMTATWSSDTSLTKLGYLHRAIAQWSPPARLPEEHRRAAWLTDMSPMTVDHSGPCSSRQADLLQKINEKAAWSTDKILRQWIVSSDSA